MADVSQNFTRNLRVHARPTCGPLHLDPLASVAPKIPPAEALPLTRSGPSLSVAGIGVLKLSVQGERCFSTTGVNHAIGRPLSVISTSSVPVQLSPLAKIRSRCKEQRDKDACLYLRIASYFYPRPMRFSRPTVRPVRLTTSLIAMVTPGMKLSRLIESCLIVRVCPRPPNTSS